MASTSERDDTDQETDQETEKDQEKGETKKQERPELPEMTLYRLDLDRIISKGGEIFDDTKRYEKFEYGKLLCDNIINWYNSKNEESSSDEDEAANDIQTQQRDEASESCSQGSSLDRQETDDPIYEEEEKYAKFEKDYDEISNSLVVGYRQKKTRKNELVQALSKLGFTENENEANTQTISVILFVIMGSNESPSIYALTTNQARFVIEDFCDDDFAFKIAKCWVDPNVKATGKRHLVGNTYASSNLYRQDGIPIHMSGNDFVSSLKSRFRGDSKIVKVNKSLQLKSKKEARVNVTRKGVHICKKQTIEQFVGVIEDMESSMNGGDEEHQNMAYLDYIKQVKDKDLKRKLEHELIKMVWNDILERRGGKEISQAASTLEEQDSGFNTEATHINTEERSGKKHGTSVKENTTGHIDFCYRDYELYYKGSDFQVVSGRKTIKWNEPKSYEEVLEDLDDVFKKETKLEQFAEAIKKKKLKFQTESQDGSNTVTGKMMEFFHGECRYLKDQTYCRKNGKWYEMKDRDEERPVKKLAEKNELHNELIHVIWTDICRKREGNEPQEEGDDTSMKDSENCSNIPQQTTEDSSSKLHHCEKPANIVEDNIDSIISSNIEFCYHNEDEYNKGYDFQIFRKPEFSGDPTSILTEWRYPKSYEEVLEDFEAVFKDRKQFAKEIKNAKLSFKCKGKQKRQCDLMDFLQCTLRRRKLEIYYKMDGDWSEVHQRFISNVHKEFQNLLVQKFEDQTSVVHLNEPWIKDMYTKCNKADFERVTGMKKESVKKIWKKMKLANEGKVNRSNLEKQKSKLSSSYFVKAVDNFISKTKIDVSMDEAKYNEIFSFKDGKNTKDRKAEWYVGDRIEPQHIEIFDIMKVDRDGKNLYLYHVKEEFGNKTRDACSQIRVSALAIHAARSGNDDDEDILGKFYDLAVQYKEEAKYRLKEKEKLLKYRKEDFKNLFKTRRITYVYAFLDTHPDEAKMSDERDKQLGQTSRFESNIARLELLHLNPLIEGLGFQLAICQIERIDSNPLATQLKEEEGKMEMDPDTDGMEEDSSSTPPGSPCPQTKVVDIRSPEKKKPKN